MPAAMAPCEGVAAARSSRKEGAPEKPPQARHSAPQVLEACCGSAALSAACIQAGLPALGVDLPSNRHDVKAPWVAFDIAGSGGVERLLDLAGQCPDLQLVWMGLACGTASRAREIAATPGPCPLRTVESPWGRPLTELNEAERHRLLAANALYRAALHIIQWCYEHNVGWVVENPYNSLLWYLPEFVELLAVHGVDDAEYDACMFGGRRLKRQRLRGTATSIIKYFKGKRCDGSHQHLPWGKAGGGFATAEEAEYPDAFCERVAACLRPRSPTATPGQTVAAAVAAARPPQKKTPPPNSLKAAVGTQPRGGRCQPVVAEYADIKLVQCTVKDLTTLNAAVDDRCRVLKTTALGQLTLHQVIRGHASWRVSRRGMWARSRWSG